MTNRGFTLTELLIVIGLLFIIFGMTNLTIINTYRHPVQTGAGDVLITDLRSQQAKAMTGDAKGASPSSYGIYFGPTSYTLFKGSNYSANDPANFTVNLSTDFQFTNVSFTSSQVVFQKGSGEVAGWVAGRDGVTITDVQGGSNKSIKINKYGATY